MDAKDPDEEDEDLLKARKLLKLSLKDDLKSRKKFKRFAGKLNIVGSVPNEALAIHILNESQNLTIFRKRLIFVTSSGPVIIKWDTRFHNILNLLMYSQRAVRTIFKSNRIVLYIVSLTRTTCSTDLVDPMFFLGKIAQAAGKNRKKWEHVLDFGILDSLIQFFLRICDEEPVSAEMIEPVKELWVVLRQGCAVSPQMKEAILEKLEPHFPRILEVSPKEVNDATKFFMGSAVMFFYDMVTSEPKLAAMVKNSGILQNAHKLHELYPDNSSISSQFPLVIRRLRKRMHFASLGLKLDLPNMCGDKVWDFQNCSAPDCAFRANCTKLRLCSGCKYVFYCSVGCQKRSWKAHKKVCKKFQETKNSLPDPDELNKKDEIKYVWVLRDIGIGKYANVGQKGNAFVFQEEL